MTSLKITRVNIPMKRKKKWWMLACLKIMNIKAVIALLQQQQKELAEQRPDAYNKLFSPSGESDCPWDIEALSDLVESVPMRGSNVATDQSKSNNT